MLDDNAKKELLAWLSTMGKRAELRDNPQAERMELGLIEETLFSEGARTDSKIRTVFHHLKTREGLLYWPNAPQIRAAVSALRRASGDPEGKKAGDRSQLSTDEQYLLFDKVIPTAKRWLKIPGLRQQAARTLDYWGEEYE